ncbi:MAG: ABC transporter permease, partial [Bowdeniella nasicola]|nr:ABC transporter permease [Bowdeniella nasicola]
NIAIEGQLLAGAFTGAVVASLANSPTMGMLLAPLAGVAVSLLLGLFTIKYRVDHIIVGVVLNMLVLGLTSFLYSSWLTEDPNRLNRAMGLPRIALGPLADIPVIGPVFFDQSLLVYLMYIIVIVMQFSLFNTRWGLRLRACGEHPKAADTVGIHVNRTRWRAVMIGGLLAGLGGAFFSVGLSLAFSKDMTAGNGFIALAAMILGRWNPKGAVMAAAIFGFATNLGYIMQGLGTSIPYEFMLMVPYVVTVLAVAGFVGAVRPPAMEGKPYP